MAWTNDRRVQTFLDGRSTVAVVETRDQVVENILHYTSVVGAIADVDPTMRRALLDTLSRTQAWFAIFRDGWKVAPAKFIGYADMTLATYYGARKSLNGTAATARVSSFGCSEVSSDHPAYQAMYDLTVAAGAPHRQGTRVFVLTGEDVPDAERRIIDGVIAMLDRAELSKDGRERLRTRI